MSDITDFVERIKALGQDGGSILASLAADECVTISEYSAAHRDIVESFPEQTELINNVFNAVIAEEEKHIQMFLGLAQELGLAKAERPEFATVDYDG